MAETIVLPQWTSAPPTEPGVYLWSSGDGTLPPSWILVERRHRELIAWAFGSEMRIDLSSGQWCGPIEVMNDG